MGWVVGVGLEGWVGRKTGELQSVLTLDLEVRRYSAKGGRGFVEGVSKEMVVRRDEWVSAEMKGGKCVCGGEGVRFPCSHYHLLLCCQTFLPRP